MYTYLEAKSLEVKYIRSTVDGKEYLVRVAPNMVEAANMLAILNEKMTKLVKYLFDNKDTGDLTDNKSAIIRLKENYNGDAISESSISNKHTSYTINKGEKIVFCLRKKNETQELIDLNTVMFVAIHELGHVMSESIGHNKEFWDNMTFLLVHAIKQCLYTEQNFGSTPMHYCGMVIRNSPLNCCHTSKNINCPAS
jgi:predicted metal-dependent hydrolase